MVFRYLPPKIGFNDGNHFTIKNSFSDPKLYLSTYYWPFFNGKKNFSPHFFVTSRLKNCNSSTWRTDFPELVMWPKGENKMASLGGIARWFSKWQLTVSCGINKFPLPSPFPLPGNRLKVDREYFR